MSIAAVSPDQWSSPTPYEGWTVRDVVSHLVDSSKLFLGFIGRSLPDGAPTVADEAPNCTELRAVSGA
jgi:uncharacterized protein (TIGR03083 family)